MLWRMHRYEFDLDLTPEQYVDYYRGVADRVFVRSSGGQTVEFPASLLQRFLMPDGIRGRFVLTCDEHYRNPELRRVNA
jgi:hypothetical protein